MRQKLLLIYFNIALFCVLLVGLELVGQVAYALVKGYPVYEGDQHLVSQAAEQPFELHPFLVARLRSDGHFTQSGHTVTTTAGHTRWTGAAGDTAGVVRVALVGGSTTFGAGVTDSASWAARLQAMLGAGYAVTNFGMPGFSSAEGAIQMALIVPEARPDIVVFFEGWNDLHNFHDSALGPDYYSHGIRQYSNLDIQRPQTAGLFAKLSQVSAIAHVASVIANRLRPTGATAQPGSEVLGSAPSSEPDLFVEQIFRRNLATMRLLAEQAGAHAIFVTQVLDMSRFVGDGSSWWTPHIRNDAMPGLLQRMNRIVAQSCAPAPEQCAVLDAMGARAWLHDDFIDEGHFSTEGNAAFAGLVAAQVTEIASRRGGRHPDQP